MFVCMFGERVYCRRPDWNKCYVNRHTNTHFYMPLEILQRLSRLSRINANRLSDARTICFGKFFHSLYTVFSRLWIFLWFSFYNFHFVCCIYFSCINLLSLALITHIFRWKMKIKLKKEVTKSHCMEFFTQFEKILISNQCFSPPVQRNALDSLADLFNDFVDEILIAQFIRS